MSSIKGIRFPGIMDMITSQILSHANDIIDIYSNSWGPVDTGSNVEGPGMLTKMTLRNAAIQVSAICRSTQSTSDIIYQATKQIILFFITQQMIRIYIFTTWT